jgi:hypothetical protein
VARAEAPRRASQALVLLALLYVVGATTFLLARELTREPPPAPRTDVITAGDLGPLADRIAALDEQARAALAQLRSNDERQRQDAHELSLRINALAGEQLPRAELERRLADLEATCKALATKTQLVREDVEAALRELKGLRGRAEKEPPRAEPPPATPRDPPPPERTPEEIERDRLVNEYIAKLGDKKASNEARYNAAVSLGDLRHPSAIPALIDALENDRYDLVCRAAAWSLGVYGKEAVVAIPALIRQLGGEDAYVGYMCERALGDITKAATGAAVAFGFDPTWTKAQRKKVQKQWEEWWEQKKAELLPEAG